MYSALDSFASSVSSERSLLEEKKPVPHHPNILLIMTSGLSNKEIEESIRRYIPRSDIFPCDDHPLVIPSYSESDLSGSYIRPSSPGLLDWEDDCMDLKDARKHHRDSPGSSSPSIGHPVQFPNLAHFARSSTVFHHHYTSAGGECPGRATLLTGQLPPIHGVRTSLEKQGIRSELKVDEVPTLGHYLNVAGYDVVYKGEWGLSEVQSLREHPILELLGVDQSDDEDLQPYGFTEWESHDDLGWYNRCVKITSEAVECIRRRESVMSAESMRGSCPPPWALVVSYPDIMPRVEKEGNWQVIVRDTDDIPLSGSWQDFSILQKENLSFGLTGSLSCNNLHRMDDMQPDFLLPPPQQAPPSTESHLPRVQKQYKEYCSHVVPPDSSFSSDYHSQVAKLDNLLGELLQEVLRSDASNTVILFTSTTGNLVGDHGLWGCCYCGYEGAIQVPCILYLPQRYNRQRMVAYDEFPSMTSSIDVLPTLLHLAGVDISDVQKRLRITHKKVFPLPGRDLFQDEKEVPVYYQSEDVAMPINQSPSWSVPPLFEGSVDQFISRSRSVAVVIADLKEEKRKRRMKLCYYSSDPRSASDCDLLEESGKECEWEMFDLDIDEDEVGDVHAL